MVTSPVRQLGSATKSIRCPNSALPPHRKQRVSLLADVFQDSFKIADNVEVTSPQEAGFIQVF